jgi:hypothetical protein
MISWEWIPSLHLGSTQAADGGVEGDSAIGMGLGIEEHLDVDGPLCCDPLEVGHREVVEVGVHEQDGHALVVLREER